MARKSIPVSENLKDALDLFDQNGFLKDGPNSDYRTVIRRIQYELNPNINTSPQILEDWILNQISQSYSDSVFDLVDNVINEFDNNFPNVSKIGRYNISRCKTALKSFTKFILGYYKADLYMALDRMSDLESCKIVARNALFCTVDVANKIFIGEMGVKDNCGKGNPCYSWYRCKYQRKKPKQIKGDKSVFSQEDPNPLGIEQYIYDENTQANHAIKYAIIKGLPLCPQAKIKDFDNYMACHIWDETCYDYRYHTSIFNLVLLPSSIGGLSDYHPVVKEILRYEAAMRFGVYPENCKYKMTEKAKKIYNDLYDFWRQPKEHDIAVVRRAKNFQPTELTNESISKLVVFLTKRSKDDTCFDLLSSL
jgi:hypothetical protein